MFHNVLLNWIIPIWLNYYCPFPLKVSFSNSFVHRTPSTPFTIRIIRIWCLSGYASQSSSSVVECGAGSGGMTSDILAKAPLVVVGVSLDSPPAGPLPDIPAVGTGCCLCLYIPTVCIVLTVKFSLTFPSHSEFIEKIRHEVTAARCHSHC